MKRLHRGHPDDHFVFSEESAEDLEVQDAIKNARALPFDGTLKFRDSMTEVQKVIFDILLKILGPKTAALNVEFKRQVGLCGGMSLSGSPKPFAGFILFPDHEGQETIRKALAISN